MKDNNLIIWQDLTYYCYRYSNQKKNYYCNISKYFKDGQLNTKSKSVYLPFYIDTNKKFKLDIC